MSKFKEHFTYALHPSFLPFYLAFFFGERLMFFSGVHPLAGTAVGSIVSVGIALVGVAVVAGSLVGLLRKVIVETT